MKKSIFYHVLEYGNYGQIGHQGCFDTLQEAENQITRLSNFFPDGNFVVHTTDNCSEPVIVNV